MDVRRHSNGVDFEDILLEQDLHRRPFFQFIFQACQLAQGKPPTSPMRPLFRLLVAPSGAHTVPSST